MSYLQESRGHALAASRSGLVSVCVYVGVADEFACTDCRYPLWRKADFNKHGLDGHVLAISRKMWSQFGER